MKNIILIYTALILANCGTEEPEREYDNPYDPDRELIETSENWPGESLGKEEVEVEAPFVKSTCLLGNCSLPENAAFNFSQRFNLTPPGSAVVEIHCIA